MATIPNSAFLTEMVTSGNLGALNMLVQIDFYIGVDQDIALAKRLVAAAISDNEHIHPDQPARILVSQVLQEQMTTVRLRAKAHVVDVRKEKIFESTVTERVLADFLAHDVLPRAILHRSLPQKVQAPVRPVAAA